MNPSASPVEHVPTRREWFALAVLSLGLRMIVLDGIIVFVGGSIVAAAADTGNRRHIDCREIATNPERQWPRISIV